MAAGVPCRTDARRRREAEGMRKGCARHGLPDRSARQLPRRIPHCGLMGRGMADEDGGRRIAEEQRRVGRRHERQNMSAARIRKVHEPRHVAHGRIWFQGTGVFRRGEHRPGRRMPRSAPSAEPRRGREVVGQGRCSLKESLRRIRIGRSVRPFRRRSRLRTLRFVQGSTRREQGPGRSHGAVSAARL